MAHLPPPPRPPPRPPQMPAPSMAAPSMAAQRVPMMYPGQAMQHHQQAAMANYYQAAAQINAANGAMLQQMAPAPLAPPANGEHSQHHYMAAIVRGMQNGDINIVASALQGALAARVNMPETFLSKVKQWMDSRQHSAQSTKNMSGLVGAAGVNAQVPNSLTGLDIGQLQSRFVEATKAGDEDAVRQILAQGAAISAMGGPSILSPGLLTPGTMTPATLTPGAMTPGLMTPLLGVKQPVPGGMTPYVPGSMSPLAGPNGVSGGGITPMFQGGSTPVYGQNSLPGGVTPMIHMGTVPSSAVPSTMKALTPIAVKVNLNEGPVAPSFKPQPLIATKQQLDDVKEMSQLVKCERVEEEPGSILPVSSWSPLPVSLPVSSSSQLKEVKQAKPVKQIVKQMKTQANQDEAFSPHSARDVSEVGEQVALPEADDIVNYLRSRSKETSVFKTINIHFNGPGREAIRRVVEGDVRFIVKGDKVTLREDPSKKESLNQFCRQLVRSPLTRKRIRPEDKVYDTILKAAHLAIQAPSTGVVRVLEHVAQSTLKKVSKVTPGRYPANMPLVLACIIDRIIVLERKNGKSKSLEYHLGHSLFSIIFQRWSLGTVPGSQFLANLLMTWERLGYFKGKYIQQCKKKVLLLIAYARSDGVPDPDKEKTAGWYRMVQRDAGMNGCEAIRPRKEETEEPVIEIEIDSQAGSSMSQVQHPMIQEVGTADSPAALDVNPKADEEQTGAPPITSELASLCEEMTAGQPNLAKTDPAEDQQPNLATADPAEDQQPNLATADPVEDQPASANREVTVASDSEEGSSRKRARIDEDDAKDGNQVAQPTDGERTPSNGNLNAAAPHIDQPARIVTDLLDEDMPSNAGGASDRSEEGNSPKRPRVTEDSVPEPEIQPAVDASVRETTGSNTEDAVPLSQPAVFELPIVASQSMAQDATEDVSQDFAPQGVVQEATQETVPMQEETENVTQEATQESTQIEATQEATQIDEHSDVESEKAGVESQVACPEPVSSQIDEAREDAQPAESEGNAEKPTVSDDAPAAQPNAPAGEVEASPEAPVTSTADEEATLLN